MVISHDSRSLLGRDNAGVTTEELNSPNQNQETEFIDHDSSMTSDSAMILLAADSVDSW